MFILYFCTFQNQQFLPWYKLIILLLSISSLHITAFDHENMFYIYLIIIVIIVIITFTTIMLKAWDLHGDEDSCCVFLVLTPSNVSFMYHTWRIGISVQKTTLWIIMYFFHEILSLHIHVLQCRVLLPSSEDRRKKRYYVFEIVWWGRRIKINHCIVIDFCGRCVWKLRLAAEGLLICFVLALKQFSLNIPYILESNPHPFYSFRGLKNQMRMRIKCGLDSRSRAGVWQNVRAVRTIQGGKNEAWIRFENIWYMFGVCH
jgi:hypothetical protein